MMPVYMSKMGGFLFITFGVIVLIASLFTINPIWNYGPYDPSPVSAGTQPDWYIGFADGALRLVPPGWEFVFLDRTWSFNILVPLVGLGLFIVVVALYPFIEAWITGDKREHHIAQRPRNSATRTAIGAGGVTFYAVLWAAASSDIIATHFYVTMEGVIHTLQALLCHRPDHRVLRHQAHLHRAPEEGPRDRTARLRVRSHRPPARWRVHRGAPAGRRVRALEARRQRQLRAAHRASERQGPHPLVREHPCRAVALAVRGPPRPAHAVRARRRGALTSTTSWSTSRPKSMPSSRPRTSAPVFRMPRTSRSTTVTTPRRPFARRT